MKHGDAVGDEGENRNDGATPLCVGKQSGIENDVKRWMERVERTTVWVLAGDERRWGQGKTVGYEVAMKGFDRRPLIH